MKQAIYKRLLAVNKTRAGFLCLIDPDDHEVCEVGQVATMYEQGGADAILIGGSMMLHDRFAKAVKEIKRHIKVPLIIFPGIFNFVSPHANALFMLNMISSRNPQVLIDEQVRCAPLVYKAGIEVIPTAYLLIESGNYSSVQYMSHSFPIPRKKNDIAVAHSLAAQYLGMKMIYLEAGSGAEKPVPNEMITAVKKYVEIPVIVGGGVNKPRIAREKVEAGADFVVIGTALDEQANIETVKAFADAIHKPR